MIDEAFVYLISSLSYCSALVKESQTFYFTFYEQIYFEKNALILQIKITW